MTDKTHFADNATLAYITQIESQLSAANARLAGIVEECAMVCDQYRQTEWVSEYPHAITAAVNIANKIRALAPAIAEKVNAEGDEYELTGPSYARRLVKKQSKAPAPIPQPADGVVVPSKMTLMNAAFALECPEEVPKEKRMSIAQKLLAAAREPRFLDSDELRRLENQQFNNKP